MNTTKTVTLLLAITFLSLLVFSSKYWYTYLLTVILKDKEIVQTVSWFHRENWIKEYLSTVSSTFKDEVVDSIKLDNSLVVNSVWITGRESQYWEQHAAYYRNTNSIQIVQSSSNRDTTQEELDNILVHETIHYLFQKDYSLYSKVATQLSSTLHSNSKLYECMISTSNDDCISLASNDPVTLNLYRVWGETFRYKWKKDYDIELIKKLYNEELYLSELGTSRFWYNYYNTYIEEVIAYTYMKSISRERVKEVYPELYSVFGEQYFQN